LIDIIQSLKTKIRYNMARSNSRKAVRKVSNRRVKRVLKAPKPKRGVVRRATKPRPKRGVVRRATKPRPKRGVVRRATKPRPKRGVVRRVKRVNPRGVGNGRKVTPSNSTPTRPWMTNLAQVDNGILEGKWPVKKILARDVSNGSWVGKSMRMVMFIELVSSPDSNVRASSIRQIDVLEERMDGWMIYDGFEVYRIQPWRYYIMDEPSTNIPNERRNVAMSLLQSYQPFVNLGSILPGLNVLLPVESFRQWTRGISDTYFNEKRQDTIWPILKASPISEIQPGSEVVAVMDYSFAFQPQLSSRLRSLKRMKIISFNDDNLTAELNGSVVSFRFSEKFLAYTLDGVQPLSFVVDEGSGRPFQVNM
jgi:hypothetical protein